MKNAKEQKNSPSLMEELRLFFTLVAGLKSVHFYHITVSTACPPRHAPTLSPLQKRRRHTKSCSRARGYCRHRTLYPTAYGTYPIMNIAGRFCISGISDLRHAATVAVRIYSVGAVMSQATQRRVCGEHVFKIWAYIAALR